MKRGICRYGILIFVVATALMSLSVAMAQAPFAIELRVSKDTIFVNDEFQLVVHVEYSSEAGKVEIGQPEFPEMVEFEKVGEVGFSQRQEISTSPLTKEPQSRAVYDFSRTYKALKPGQFLIPNIELTIKDPAQPNGVLKTRTKTVQITVLDLSQRPPGTEENKIAKPKEEGLRDIKAPLPVPRWVFLLMGVGGVSILLALAIVIARVIKPSGDQKPKSEKVRVIENPYARAMSKLKEIKPPPPLSDDESITNFYIKLSDIVKEYLASHHGVMGFEATSWEITSEMHDVYSKFKRGGEIKLSLNTFLGDVDLGKYAKARREQDFMLMAIERAKSFVNIDNEITRKSTEQSDS